MAIIAPHQIDLPKAEELGPDPEPIGTRFERLLAERERRHVHGGHDTVRGARPPRPQPKVNRYERAMHRAAGRAHVIPGSGR